jgi:hypothetical protein
MKLIFSSIIVASLVIAVGCDKGGSAGGPGATSPETKQPRFGTADDTFSLTAASMTVKQGDVSPGTIGIKRGTNFAQDVTIAFADLPSGVTIEPASPVLRHGDSEAKITLTIREDAALGVFTVKLLGHPATGGDSTNQFSLTIAKKDSFTLSMPFWTTGIKQGEAKAVTISISREKQFDQNVTLKFDNLPKGITVDPASSVIKNGEAEVKLTLKASDDATLGDFSVMVTGHPAKGLDATHEFKFSVTKK